jgi:hypothetical protein
MKKPGQTITQYNKMLWMREYRRKIKENEIIYIKKSKIVYNN